MTPVQFGMAAGAERAHQAQPVQYVSGEVCLVVETPPDASGAGYETARRLANEALRRLPPDGGQTSKSVFGRDLRPNVLRKYIASGEDVLRPLELPGGEGGPRPTVTLPGRSAGERTTSLHFFRLPDADDPRLVKEAVDQINLNRARIGAGQGVRVLAATLMVLGGSALVQDRRLGN